MSESLARRSRAHVIPIGRRWAIVSSGNAQGTCRVGPGMRVMLLVTRGDLIGGAQVHVRDLAVRLCRDGGDATVVTGVAGALTDQLTDAGIPWQTCRGMLREVDPLRDFQAVRGLLDLLHEIRPDIVSTHSSKAGILGRIAARIARVPAIFTAHGWAFTEGVPEPRRTIYRQIERACAPLAAKIVCVSDHDGAIAAKAGISPGRICVIHNGMPDIDPGLAAQPGEAKGRPRAVMIARFDRQKDHATLLAALVMVPELGLDLIGDGPGRAETERLAIAMGLEDRVAFLGQRADVAGLLSRAHLFVLSSRWEGFPRSTLEAMRAGLPVVVTDVGGAAEAVTEGLTGHVVPPGNTTALAERLRQLTVDPWLRAAMGAAGRRRYEDAFTFERMYDATMDVWTKAAGS